MSIGCTVDVASIEMAKVCGRTVGGANAAMLWIVSLVGLISAAAKPLDLCRSSVVGGVRCQ